VKQKINATLLIKQSRKALKAHIVENLFGVRLLVALYNNRIDDSTNGAEHRQFQIPTI
jgi:hypothetical protein